jgi:hypothetical protein
MDWRIARPAVVVATVMIMAGLAPPAASASSQVSNAGVGFETRVGPHGEVDVNVCSTAVPIGYASCHVRERLSPGSVRPSDFVGEDGAYNPKYLQSAYNAPSDTNGVGQTVAIVDAFDAPNAESDLAEYRETFGLPPCTTENGCFTKIDQRGGTDYPPYNAAWEQEIALDIDMVSALCPNCNILLVEADDAAFTNLGTAVNLAVELGATIVSNSYGSVEWSGEAEVGAAYYDHPGVAILASTGDTGYGVSYPAAASTVISVGGTSLLQATETGTRDATETVWSGAGSGCSDFEPKPVWQTDTECPRRSVADVAAVADPNTGVWSYNGDWAVLGGTSAAAPIVAALYALAENPPASDHMASYLYARSASLNDVITGSNGNCGESYLCTGTVGYDGPTGLGTPNGTAAFATELVEPDPPDFAVDATPIPTPLRVGDVANSSVTVDPENGFTGNVQLSAAVSPSTGLSKTFAPAEITVGAEPGTSTLTYVARKPGTYTVTITATDGTMTRTRVRRVYVNDFSIKLTPATATVIRGNLVRFTVTIVPAGSFGQPVKLSISGLRPRDTVTYKHNPAPYHGSQTITIKTSKLDAKGTLTMHLRGNSGPLNHIAVAKVVLK